MIVLGIESSCDDTGIALYDTMRDAQLGPAGGLIGQALYSQTSMHAQYGGVVPELASRDHIKRITPLTHQVLAQAQISYNAIDLIAYTQGPGLSGALLVGAAAATGLAYALQKPALPIHHLEGHLLSPLLSKDPPEFPFVCLLVSGGHTQLMRVDGVGQYQLLGDTVDDAAGEAFDKSAKLMGLSYPGGPAIAKLALLGDAKRFKLPRPMLRSTDCDFSYSGLKTAVLTTLKRDALESKDFPDLAASLQAAIVDVLCAKSLRALQTTGLMRLVVAGGVSANLALRQTLQNSAKANGWRVYFPELALCSDNGAMIAFAGALRAQAMIAQGLGFDDFKKWGFDVKARWPLAELTAPG